MELRVGRFPLCTIFIVCPFQDRRRVANKSATPDSVPTHADINSKTEKRDKSYNNENEEKNKYGLLK